MKKIKMVFKSGAVVETGYSYKAYNALVDAMKGNPESGAMVESSEYLVDTSLLSGIFFVNEPDAPEVSE